MAVWSAVPLGAAAHIFHKFKPTKNRPPIPAEVKNLNSHGLLEREKEKKRKKKKRKKSALRRCVKVEVAVLVSPSLKVLAISVDVNQHETLTLRETSQSPGGVVNREVVLRSRHNVDCFVARAVPADTVSVTLFPTTVETADWKV